jgi:hypothetical protein
MNKSKLIRIIVKDLEELKMLSEEIAETNGNTTLIIDLAVSKAKLLCQEIELLHEVSDPSDSLSEDEGNDLVDEEESEVSDLSVSDPELEIINFEEHEFIEEETIGNQDEPIEENEEEYSEDEPEPEVQEEISEINIEEDVNETKEEIDASEEEDNQEEEYLTDEEANANEEVEEEKIEEKDETQAVPNIQYTELKSEPQSEIREIQIEDLDDDDIEPMKLSAQPSAAERPVMREIPKPEGPLQESSVQEKVVIGDSFQKERSLNDVIGDNKQAETTLTNGPINSLKAAIGLNDRFLFIREIFNNNSDKYNTIIDHLDKLETIQEAVEYLKANLTLQKNETSMKFVDLLKRRFSK